MNSPAQQPSLLLRRQRTRQYAIGLAALLLVVALTVTVVSLAQGEPGGLMPEIATLTPGPQVISGQPLIVTFDELNGDPFRLQDSTIQVTGSLRFLDAPECPNYSGPRRRWALIAGNLQLEATGLESMVRYLHEGETTTAQGIWRLYEGPIGCGKEPARSSVWYLQATQLVVPNPVVVEPGVYVVLVPGGNIPQGNVATATPAAGAVPVVTLQPAATPSPSPIPVVTLAGTATLGPAATATVAGVVTVPVTATVATPAATVPGTVDSATPASTNTPAIPAGTPTAALATATQDPGAYPGPGSTSTPTGGYP